MSDLIAARLGTAVEYRDGDGYRKLALVIATPETMDPDTHLEVPEPGRVHLAVFSPTGTRYTSYNIAEGEGPHTFSVL